MSEPTEDDIRRQADQDHTAARSDAAERVKIQWSIADATLKALLWANGGAMIALFTFVGNVLAKSDNRALFDAASLKWSFGAFVTGLMVALFAHAFAFLSQDRFYHTSMKEAWRKQRVIQTGQHEKPTPEEMADLGQGIAFYGIAFTLALAAIICFAVGCWWALGGVLVG